MPVAVRYKTWGCGRSLAEIAVFLECCVLCQVEARTGW